jgi:hypothetical protein
MEDRLKATVQDARAEDDAGEEEPSEMNPLVASSMGGYGGTAGDSIEGVPINVLEKLDLDGGWILQDELQLVFWFGSPQTFQVGHLPHFRLLGHLVTQQYVCLQILLDVLMLMNCFYTALFIVYFLTLAPYGEMSMMLLPLAINDIFVTPMIVKSFFYIKSVTVLRSEIVGEVQELEHEMAKAVQDVLLKLSEECIVRNLSAADIFKRWDINNDGDINVLELKKGLKKLGIHLSPLNYR